ncbi:MAG: DegT/DnrJ/EryC1/StrS family aminotransferase [Magnetococcales bacterium]|nr:DegT/DnrJ/EryC1/StrS family aminotransferase [Magnetococcales bacterium]
MTKPFIIFGAPIIQQDELNEVLSVLESGWLGTGPRVQAFEQAFATYKGVQHAVALNSCTAALHLSLLASGVGPGDEVITTPMTFCATVNAIIHTGATPVLADIDPDDLNISVREVAQRITPNTRAILPVHFAGMPCDMDPLMALAERHDLKVIEDCAHAIETEYRGRKAGTFGDFGCFSFYVTKNIATGEGGMVLAKNPNHLERLRRLSLHGMSRDAWKRFGSDGYAHYQVLEAGFKYNMTDIQAAIGLHQLPRVESWLAQREALWQHYDDAFSALPVTRPGRVAEDCRHGRHLYTLRINEQKTGIDRDSFLNAMEQHRIGVGVHYLSIPEHPYYQERFGWRPEAYPIAMQVGRETVSLPLSPKLTDAEVERIIDAVRKSVGA